MNLLRSRPHLSRFETTPTRPQTSLFLASDYPFSTSCARIREELSTCFDLRAIIDPLPPANRREKRTRIRCRDPRRSALSRWMDLPRTWKGRRTQARISTRLLRARVRNNQPSSRCCASAVKADVSSSRTSPLSERIRWPLRRDSPLSIV